jgi:hypothetical protein
MSDDARMLRIRNLFWDAVEKALAGRRDVNVTLTTEGKNGTVFTKVTIVGEFQLSFAVAANDEVVASGPKGPVIGCSLDGDSIANAIRNEILRELGPEL